MTTAFEGIEKKYGKYLDNYLREHRYDTGALLNFFPLGDTGKFLGTITVFDEEGRKSQAYPMSKFLKLVSEVETILTKLESKPSNYFNIVYGQNPGKDMKEFLYRKKIHRFFLIDGFDIPDFIAEYTSPGNRTNRSIAGIDVLITMG